MWIFGFLITIHLMAITSITNPCLNQLFHQELQKMVIFKFIIICILLFKKSLFSLSPFYYHEFIDCYLFILQSITVIHFDAQIVPNLAGVL